MYDDPKFPSNQGDGKKVSDFFLKIAHGEDTSHEGGYDHMISLLEIGSFRALGNMLRKVRGEASQTLEEASAIFDVDNSTLSRIEKGERIPSENLCKKMADEYNLPPYELGYVVKTLKSNESARDPKSVLAQYLELTKELKNDLEAGKISIDVAEEIVSAWENVMDEAKKLKVKHIEEGGPNAGVMLEPIEPLEPREAMFEQNTLR